MFKNILTLFLLLFATFAIASPHVYAQAEDEEEVYDYEIKDTVYFMKDDNEFSPEEMDEEAEYMYRQCTENSIQSVYFDCGCIAGAFRQEREKQGPWTPQNVIMNALFDENERGCANTVGIAGEAYESCMERSKTMRPRSRDNKRYCECVARTKAKNFKKRPYLSSSNLEDIAVDAMISCES